MKSHDMAELAQTLFEEIGDAAFITDPVTSRLVDVNPMAERMTGLSRAALLQVPLNQLFRCDGDSGLAHLQRALHSTQTFHSQEGYFLRRGTGDDWTSVNLTLTRLHTEGGQLGLVLARDVTRRVQAEERLRLANATLERRVQERTVELARVNESLREKVAEQERAAAALRDSEDRFRGAFDHTGVAMVITDIDNRFVRVNAAFARMFGYAPREMLGLAMADITHPDDLAEIDARRKTLLDGEGPFFQMERRYLRRDGHTFWGLTNVSLVRASDGKPHLYVGQVQDISERKKALERVVGYNERLKILHQIDKALLSGEDPGAIAAAALPLLRNLLGVGRAIVNLFDLEKGEVEWLAAVGRRHVRVGPGVRYSIRLMGDVEALRRGEEQWIDVHALPPGPEVEALLASGVHNYAVVPMIAGGELIGAVSFGGTSEPVSAEQIGIAKEVATQFAIAIAHARLHEQVKRQAQELEDRVRARTRELEAAHADLQATNAELGKSMAEAKAANSELEAFSYSVSHDLRAPLRAIDGFSRILVEKYASHLPPEARDLLQEVRDGAREMGQLVDDLLAFSRLARQPMLTQVTHQDRLVRECLEVLRRERSGRQVELSVQNLVPARGDPSLLKQVWLNLLSNALKYTGKNDIARIEIGCRTDGEQEGEVYYFVRDNGVGFDMRYAHKLFGVFQRLHRAEEYTGTGIGLAIVHRIIHRHGGRVWAEAQPGEGATFHFTLKGVDLER